MIPEYESKIAFRLSTREKQLVEQLIRKGTYCNMSQVVRTALKEFLLREARSDG